MGNLTDNILVKILKKEPYLKYLKKGGKKAWFLVATSAASPLLLKLGFR